MLAACFEFKLSHAARSARSSPLATSPPPVQTREGPRPRPPVNAVTRAAAAESRGGRNGRTGRRPPLVIAADARAPPEGHLSRRRRAHGLRRSRAAAGAALASLPWRGRSSGGGLVSAAMTTRMGPSGCSPDLVLMDRHATPVRHGRPKPLQFPSLFLGGGFLLDSFGGVGRNAPAGAGLQLAPQVDLPPKLPLRAVVHLRRAPSAPPFRRRELCDAPVGPESLI